MHRQEGQVGVRLRDLLRTFHFVWKHGKLSLAVLWLNQLVITIAPSGIALVSGLALSSLVGVAQPDVAPQRIASTLLYMWVGAGLSVLIAVFQQFSMYLEEVLRESVGISVREELLAKSAVLPLEFYESASNHDRLHRVMNSGDQLVQTVSVLSQLVTIGLGMVASLLVLGHYHWGFWIGLIPVLALSLWVNLRLGNQRKLLRREHSPVEREMSYLQNLLVDPSGAKEVRLLRTDRYLLPEWTRRARETSRRHLAFSIRNGIAQAGLLVANSVVPSVALTVAVYLIAGDHLSIGSYTTIGMAINSALSQVRMLASAVGNVSEQRVIANELFTLLGTPTEHHEGCRQAAFPNPLRQGISVKGLHYRYLGAERSSLTDVSFDVRPGERIAIVGENGSGKTTLVKCMLGLYRPTEGQILVDGIDLLNIHLDSLRSDMTACFQDFSRYALTARENIGLGRLEDLHNDSALYAAANQAGALPVIDRLEHGLDTRLSQRWANGTELSLGEWQRLALARTMLRDAQVIFLDEPTASLDPRAEAELFERFSAVAQGKTAFMVSHRLGAARLADRILVLERGRLVEEGAHVELMRLDGVYASLYRTQARWYS